MAPIYLNPLPSSSSTFPITKDDHHDDLDLDLDHNHDHDHFHLFMINSPATHDPRQTHFTDLDHDHDHDDHHNKVREPISKQDLELQAHQIITNHHDHSINGDQPARWVSSKVRLVHKMMISSSSSDDDHNKSSISMMKIKQEQEHSTTTHNTNHFAKNKNSSTVIRVCSDCSTTSTPLWRSGPRGPKSLCNACGIRQRKARRAMAEAQNGAVSHEPSPVARAHNKSQTKEKKPRTGPAGTAKKHQCKPLPAIAGPSTSKNNENNEKSLFFKDLALFPRDEEKAAFLLMELSCGLVHT